MIAALAERIRAAGGDSVVARGAARMIGGTASNAGNRVDPRSSDRETIWFAGEFAETWIGRAAAAAIGAVDRAWSDASARTLPERIRAAVRGLACSERVRLVGLWAVAAALTDAAMTPFDPRPASVGRWALWGGFLLLGLGALVWPRGVAAAWAQRSARSGRPETERCD
jgi:hypothetical protein